MMRNTKRKVLSGILILLAAVLLPLSGCGENAGGGVPDGTAEMVVLDYFDEFDIGSDRYDSYSFAVAHNFDKSANLDAAEISLTIEHPYARETTSIPVWYSYNKSSGQWTLSRKGSWSESAFSYYGDKLIGAWVIDYFDEQYTISVWSIGEDSATLDYSISAPATVSMGLDPDKELHIEGSGTYTLTGSHISIPIALPDGFYCNQGGVRLAERTTTLSIRIDPQYGFKGYLSGSLSYLAP